MDSTQDDVGPDIQGERVDSAFEKIESMLVAGSVRKEKLAEAVSDLAAGDFTLLFARLSERRSLIISRLREAERTSLASADRWRETAETERQLHGSIPDHMVDYYDNEVRADCHGAREAAREAERTSDDFETALNLLREIERERGE